MHSIQTFLTMAVAMSFPLANITQEIGTHPLSQYGIMGAVLAYFMYDRTLVGREVRTLSSRMDDMTKAMLLDIIERDTASSKTKDCARVEIAKIDARLSK